MMSLRRDGVSLVETARRLTEAGYPINKDNVSRHEKAHVEFASPRPTDSQMDVVALVFAELMTDGVLEDSLVAAIFIYLVELGAADFAEEVAARVPVALVPKQLRDQAVRTSGRPINDRDNCDATTRSHPLPGLPHRLPSLPPLTDAHASRRAATAS